MTTPFESDLDPQTDDNSLLDTRSHAHVHHTHEPRLDSPKPDDADDADDADDESDVDLGLHGDDGRDADCQIDDVVEAAITAHDRHHESNVEEKEHHLRFDEDECTDDRDEHDDVGTPFRTDSSEAPSATALIAAELPSSVDLQPSQLAPPPDPPPHHPLRPEVSADEALHTVTLGHVSETHTLGQVPLSLSGQDEADAQLVSLLPSTHDRGHVNPAATAAAVAAAALSPMHHAAMASVVATTPPHLLTATPVSAPVSLPPSRAAPINIKFDPVPLQTDGDTAGMIHMGIVPAPTSASASALPQVPVPATVSTPASATALTPVPIKKKRRTYSTEEERRNARILKNRRTAEESRQRRLRRMTELEDLARKSSEREKDLERQLDQARNQANSVSMSLKRIIQQKDKLLAEKDAEIARLRAKLGNK